MDKTSYSFGMACTFCQEEDKIAALHCMACKDFLCEDCDATVHQHVKRKNHVRTVLSSFDLDVAGQKVQAFLRYLGCRKILRAKARLVFDRFYDPAERLHYYYNMRTGTVHGEALFAATLVSLQRSLVPAMARHGGGRGAPPASHCAGPRPDVDVCMSDALITNWLSSIVSLRYVLSLACRGVARSSGVKRCVHCAECSLLQSQPAVVLGRARILPARGAYARCGRARGGHGRFGSRRGGAPAESAQKPHGKLWQSRISDWQIAKPKANK